MDQPPGFVPVNFQFAGKLLMILGGIGLLAFGITYLTGWFTLPSLILPASLILICASLYLLIFAPRDFESRN